MTPSDTPRTDAAEKPIGEFDSKYYFAVTSDFARELERENAKLREVIADLIQAHYDVYAEERWACMEQAAARTHAVLESLGLNSIVPKAKPRKGVS